MATYKSVHTGTAIDEAVTKVQEGLPKATTSTLGGIIVGDNLTIDDNGKLSASGGGSGGGTKWYKHYAQINFMNGNILLSNTISNGKITSNSIDITSIDIIIISKIERSYTDMPTVFETLYFSYLDISTLLSDYTGMIPCILVEMNAYAYLTFSVEQTTYYCMISTIRDTFTDTVTEL